MTKIMENDDELTDYIIDHAYRQMMAAKDETGQRYWCDRLTFWVKQRSPKRIQEMEREKGLA